MRLAPIAALCLLAASTVAHAQEMSPADDAAQTTSNTAVSTPAATTVVPATVLATPTLSTTLSPSARVQTNAYGTQVVLGQGAGYTTGGIVVPTGTSGLQQSTAQIGAAKAQYDAQQAQSKTTFDPFRTPAFQPAKSADAAAKDAADQARAAAALAGSQTQAASAPARVAPMQTGQENLGFGHPANGFGFSGVSNSVLTAWGWDDPRMLLARRQLAVAGVPDRVIYFEADRQSPIEFSDWVARRVAVVANPAGR